MADLHLPPRVYAPAHVNSAHRQVQSAYQIGCHLGAGDGTVGAVSQRIAVTTHSYARRVERVDASGVGACRINIGEPGRLRGFQIEAAH